jgi:hypothetical protein
VFLKLVESEGQGNVASRDILSIDAVESGKAGSVIVARALAGTDTIYMFWAMTVDSEEVVAWPFGGPWWGKAGSRYYEILDSDSLGLLVGRSKDMVVDSIWDAIEETAEMQFSLRVRRTDLDASLTR